MQKLTRQNVVLALAGGASEFLVLQRLADLNNGYPVQQDRRPVWPDVGASRQFTSRSFAQAVSSRRSCAAISFFPVPAMQRGTSTYWTTTADRSGSTAFGARHERYKALLCLLAAPTSPAVREKSALQGRIRAELPSMQTPPAIDESSDRQKGVASTEGAAHHKRSAIQARSASGRSVLRSSALDSTAEEVQRLPDRVPGGSAPPRLCEAAGCRVALPEVSSQSASEDRR